MSEPKVEQSPGRLSFLWGEEQIKIEVTRFKLNSKAGSETGEICILSTLAEHGQAPLLHESRLNFNSLQARNTLVKSLTAEIPDYPWDIIIKQLAHQTLKLMRQGEPVVRISTTDEIKPTEYLLHPIIPLNQPTVIFGDGGIGKSYLALLFHICTLLPWGDNPLGLTSGDKSTKGLILDWETDKLTVAWRLKCLEKGLGLPVLEVNYRPCSHAFADDLEQIQEAILEVGAQFVIIDSLAGACGGDLTASEPATRFYNALRQLKTTSLIIAHNPKGEGKKSIYGSAIFEHRARSVWECRGSQEPGEDELKVGVFHRKANMSRLYPSMGFKIRFHDDSTEVTRQDIKDVAALREGMAASARIYDLLREGPATTKEVSEELGLTQDYARVALNRMLTKKQVVKLTSNKWWLRIEELRTVS